jgi:serine/threonine protein kinase
LQLYRLDNSPAQNEIRAIRKLCNGKHKNIIEVFAIGEFADSMYTFIDMEICDLNLEDYNKNIWMTNLVHENLDLKGVKELQACNIMKQISDGIVFVHQQGEVHRDLKPRNGIMFSPNI